MRNAAGSRTSLNAPPKPAIGAEFLQVGDLDAAPLRMSAALRGPYPKGRGGATRSSPRRSSPYVSIRLVASGQSSHSLRSRREHPAFRSGLLAVRCAPLFDASTHCLWIDYDV